MGMELPKVVDLMVVVVIVELVRLAKNAAGDLVLVLPIVLEDNVAMMVVEETLVAHVLMVKHAKMVFALGLELDLALDESVVMTE